MKFTKLIDVVLGDGRPRKGAWIEITLASPTLSRISRRPRKGAWIEILCGRHRRT